MGLQSRVLGKKTWSASCSPALDMLQPTHWLGTTFPPSGSVVAARWKLSSAFTCYSKQTGVLLTIFILVVAVEDSYLRKCKLQQKQPMAVCKQCTSASRNLAIGICRSWEIPYKWSEVHYKHQKPFENSLNPLLDTSMSHIHTDIWWWRLICLKWNHGFVTTYLLEHPSFLSHGKVRNSDH